MASPLPIVPAPPPIEPSETFPTIDPQVFLLSASIAIVRGSNGGAPDMKRTVIREADGRCYGEISVDDAAIEELWKAVAPHYGRDERRFQIFLFRWFALMKLSASPRLSEWIASDGDGPVLLKDSLLRVAARFALNERYEFDEEEFFAEVARDDERASTKI